jgi:hypothetical protein
MKTATAAGLVIGLTFLTGCAVSVEGPTTPAAPATSQPSAPAETAPATSPTPSSTGLSKHDELRDRDFDTVVGCPTGVVVLDMHGQYVLVTEDCKKITVSASQVTVFAEHVDSVIFVDSAVQSTVTVRSADSVVMDGDQNDFYWEEGRPSSVQVRGVQNTAGPISRK